MSTYKNYLPPTTWKATTGILSQAAQDIHNRQAQGFTKQDKDLSNKLLNIKKASWRGWAFEEASIYMRAIQKKVECCYGFDVIGNSFMLITPDKVYSPRESGKHFIETIERINQATGKLVRFDNHSGCFAESKERDTLFIIREKTVTLRLMCPLFYEMEISTRDPFFEIALATMPEYNAPLKTLITKYNTGCKQLESIIQNAGFDKWVQKKDIDTPMSLPHGLLPIGKDKYHVRYITCQTPDGKELGKLTARSIMLKRAKRFPWHDPEFSKFSNYLLEHVLNRDLSNAKKLKAEQKYIEPDVEVELL